MRSPRGSREDTGGVDGGREVPRVTARGARRVRVMIAMGRPNLFGMGADALAAVVAERGEPAFRARQLYGWLYQRRVRERRPRWATCRSHCAPRSRSASSSRWPEVSGARSLVRRHAQVPVPALRRRHHRGGLHPRGRPPHHLHLDPGRLPARVRVLPHRHRRLHAQPEDRRDPRPGGDGDGGAPRSPPRTRRRRAADPFPWNIVVMGMGEPLLNVEATLDALAC